MIRGLSCVITIGMFVSTVHAVVFPGEHWETRTPAQVGMDATKLNTFATAAGNRRGCIVKDGYMVYTWGDIRSKLDWASAMKPVMSTMLFFAVHEGKLPSVDALVNHHAEKVLGKSLDKKDQIMTFRHLADMVSGYGRVESPGEAWAYNDWAINLYSKTLFDGVFQEKPDSVAKKASRLGVLQIEDGTFFGSRKDYGLLMSPRDFARIGWFWLNKGNWNGKQILPESFFDNYMKADVPSDLPRSSAETSDYLNVYFTGGGTDQTSRGPGIYGFNWWFNTGKKTWPDAPEDTFQANGHWNGEVCCVIPSLKLVVTWEGSWASRDTFNQPMNDYLKILVDSVARSSAAPSPPSESMVNQARQTTDKAGLRPEVTDMFNEKTWKRSHVVENSMTESEEEVWPEREWAKVTPEAISISSSKLDDYISWLSSKAEGKPFGTIVIRYGKIAVEHYGDGADVFSTWEIGSIRKAVGSALLGIAIEEERLSLETKVYDVWPEILQTEKDKEIKVKHLFESTSGWKRSEVPGTEWVYNNSAFTAGGMVLGRVYQLPEDKIAPLAMRRIADRIGALSWRCYHYPGDFSASDGNPGAKLAIDSNMRDLARFGYLWLRKGRWNGEQIIPESYVAEATRNQVTHLNRHYGFCWFVNDGRKLLPNAPEDTYFHVGNGKDNRRTVIMVIPSRDLVAAVGVHAAKYNITSGYRSEPMENVDEWMSKIIASVYDTQIDTDTREER